MVIFYTNYLFILPTYFKTKQYAKAWISWVLLLGSFILLRYTIEESLFPKYFLLVGFPAVRGECQLPPLLPSLQFSFQAGPQREPGRRSIATGGPAQ